MLFMKLYAFGKCTGITFMDSTMIPVRYNIKRYRTRFSQVWPKTGKIRWDGVTASSCIC